MKARLHQSHKDERKMLTGAEKHNERLNRTMRQLTTRAFDDDQLAAYKGFRSGIHDSAFDPSRSMSYPGMAHCAAFLRPLYPPFDEWSSYCEPFAGLARCVPFALTNPNLALSRVYLFDKNDAALAICNERYAGAQIQNADYKATIDLARQISTMFLFTDPPWFNLPVYTITEGVKEYYSTVFDILSRPGTKCKWMVVGPRRGSPGLTQMKLFAKKINREVHVVMSNGRMMGGQVGCSVLTNYC
jgi:hypothetical protein